MKIKENIEKTKNYCKEACKNRKIYVAIYKSMSRLIKYINKLVRSILVLWIVGDIFPELRDTIPSVYRLIDTLLIGIEYLFQFFWYIVENIIQMFC